MKKPNLTIKDIAKALNISASTVSRALNNNPDISTETIKLVQSYAKEHKYVPNTLALSLRLQRSNIIGVIIPEIANHFFSSVLSGMETVADEEDYHVIVCQSYENYEKEKKNVQALINSRVCGVLVSMAKTTTIYDHFQELIDNNIPVVFFDRICTGIDSEKVVVDDYSGTFAAVEHMIQTGCRRVAFFHAPLNLEISKNRKNGYIDAMMKYGLPVDSTTIREADTKQLGYREAIDLLQSKNRPDAFMAMNDNTASGILLATKQLGLKVPEEVSIFGFSNSNISQDTDPMLSTVEQHPQKVGEEAMRLILERVKDEPRSTAKNKYVKTSLVLRETTRKLP
ncbi:MAG: LacI family transcriptional regulator [Bacteroidales bacterium 36-12]|nr:MAG: LacI family transcriptional regulator [Bacteroidales bacterium 36-12]